MPPAASPNPYPAIIPRPVSVVPDAGFFTVDPAARIIVRSESAALLEKAALLSGWLSAELECRVGVEIRTDQEPPGAIVLSIDRTRESEEEYELAVMPERISITAGGAAGLLWGIQTLRQLLPVRTGGPLSRAVIPAVRIADRPRFSWRGVMLDVARHFFAPAAVCQLIDQAAAYKLNRLHLHLSDDQGWRIMLASRPELALVGGGSDIDGGRGGYFSADDYRALADYAASRHMILVPEIDMPGHTHAALVSCPGLNPSGISPQPYCGSAVGFSTLDTDSDKTYEFVEQVIGDLAALTPGPYLHIGGDEASATPLEAYRRFIERVQEIVTRHGKTMIGWEEITHGRLDAATIVQHWREGGRPEGMPAAKVIMSPSRHAYLDMKYAPGCPLGLDWAGHVEVDQAYCWDPADCAGLEETRILGVEALLWSETVRSWADAEYMIFPRLLGHAEIGWSPRTGRDWQEYRSRLAVHGERMALQGINFFRSPLVSWGAAARRRAREHPRKKPVEQL